MKTTTIQTLALWTAIFLAIAGGLQASEPKLAKPNIVFILLDNVGREWFGCHGSEENCTPNIDRLAQSGVRFVNCYTTVVCGPSRVELLTGRYPHRTGWHLHHDAALYGGGGLDPKREVTIARVLRDHGYATGISGKWQVNNLYDEPDVLTQHGFQEQLVWPGSIDRDLVDDAFRRSYENAIARRDAAFLTEATRKIESRYWDPVLLRNGRRERLKDRFGPDVFEEFALDFVRRHRSEPFFLYYPMVLTHGQNASEPTVTTPANRTAPPQDEKARFADMLRYADRQVGEFVDALTTMGLRENTIVFIASDNGTEKSISARCNGRIVQGGLYRINEAGGNVLLMVNCPAHIAGGRTAALSDFTDVLPTICDLTNSPRPMDTRLDGQSFAAFLKGEGTAPRKWIFNEYGPDRVVRDERYKLNQRGELFDLDNDPDEARPLAAPDSGAAAAKTRLAAVLDAMPAVTPLPFEHRSLSAFRLREQSAENPWRALPLITDGKIGSAWAQVGWGGFAVDDGALRTEPDERGMGLLLYKAEKFGNCQLCVVYRCEKPKSNSGIFVRLDDGIIGRIGEKSPEVHRDANGKLSREMLKVLEDASNRHLGAWYPVHHGYEVQIMDAADAFHRTGAIYSLAKAEPVPAKAQTEWRTMIITLQGERIAVDVDGKRLGAFDATAADPPPRQKWAEPIREIKRPAIGYIGLQNHDPGDVVWFREVSVRQTKPKNPQPVAPPLPPMPYALDDAFGGLTFSQPLAIVSAPGEKDRIFVVEKTGCIQAVTQLDQPTPAKRVFANLIERPDGKLDDKGECGLLGLAFHPGFARNGRFFVYYSLRIGGQLHQRVSRFQVSPDDPQQADAASEQPLITQADPANNHNGGDLHFGPDGFLYISVGDGGGANDVFDNARFINKGFHAAILRIDVDKRPGSLPPNPHPAVARDENGGAHYAVPADNPFIGATSHHGEAIDPATVRTEIWATGLRNPWRFCFDPPTGRLFVGDVGQNLYEEVDLITKGGDYGWSHREGLHAFDLGPGKDQPPPDFHPIDPIFEYPRTTGISITGGRVYRGGRFPEFSSAYVFADYGFGRIIVLREKDAKWKPEIVAVENGIAGIGADPRNGELLFANLGKGSVMRLAERREGVPPMPERRPRAEVK